MDSSTRMVDVAVVGGGQAGLAAGHHLDRSGADFVIFEQTKQVGASWQHRWDSLRLFTPAGFSSLPGVAFPADAEHRPTRDEVSTYLEQYAAPLQDRIRFGGRVRRAHQANGRWLLDVGEQQWSARAVIFAAGAHTQPVIPSFAADLPSDVAQLASTQYRCPDQVPPGPVVVVGAANSGAEIAADLAQHHEVRLAGRDVGYVPQLGPRTYPIMRSLGRPGAAMSQRLLAGRGDPLGRLRPGDLEAAGVVRVPRVVTVDDGALVLIDGRRIRATTVVWAIGLRPDTAWLPSNAITPDARIAQHRGKVAACDRLYTLGLPYQWSITSHLLGGVGADAQRVVKRLTSEL